MNDRLRLLRYGSLVVAALFAAGAAFHAAALLLPAVDALSPNPLWRHCLFAAMNSAFAMGFYFRWPRLWLPTLLLIAQQIWSHGRALSEAHAQGRWDWPSTGVLLVLPLALVIATSTRI